MGILGAVERAAQSYPATAPFLMTGLLALALWAWRRRRLSIMGGAIILTFATVLLYTGGGPAEARPRAGTAGPAALPPGPPGGGGATPRFSTDFSGYSSTTRIHPRFPADLALPAGFIHEHSSGGLKQGALTVRFRFRGEAKDAVRDLELSARNAGWQVEVLAPHRMVFRRDRRVVEAWFSFPGHSLVLDVPDFRQGS